jgi:hypothetical protein
MRPFEALWSGRALHAVGLLHSLNALELVAGVPLYDHLGCRRRCGSRGWCGLDRRWCRRSGTAFRCVEIGIVVPGILGARLRPWSAAS